MNFISTLVMARMAAEYDAKLYDIDDGEAAADLARLFTNNAEAIEKLIEAAEKHHKYGHRDGRRKALPVSQCPHTICVALAALDKGGQE